MNKLAERIARQTSDIEVVYAIREYVQDGVRFCDVVNPDNGQQPSMQCPVMGHDGVPLGVPDKAWTGASDIRDYPLVIIGRRSDMRQPVVLGPLRNPSLLYTGGPSPAAGQESTSSPPQVGVGDRVMKNGGSTLVLRKNGNVALDTPGSLNVQLTNGVMRVTQDGEATDRALLANPTVTKLNELITSYLALLSALQTSLAIAAAAPVAKGDLLVVTLSAAMSGVPTVSLAVLAELQSAVLFLSATAGH